MSLSTRLMIQIQYKYSILIENIEILKYENNEYAASYC